MFDRDKWIEILTTMVHNPLRTILTSISVIVGIFILVILLGLGQGLQNGAFESMQDDAANSIWINRSRTTLPYQGYQSNRNIRYHNDDHEEVVASDNKITTSSSRLQFWGTQIKWGKEAANFTVRSVHPGHQEVERTVLSSGRYINHRDVEEARKVAVIGQTIIEDLFGKIDPLGELIEVMGVKFKVVGTFNDPNSRWENRILYTPITTGQKLFNGGGDGVDMFIISTGESSFEESIAMEENIDGYLRGKHKVHPEDPRGIDVRNVNEEFQTIQDVFLGINVFIYGIGILTMLIGIIGVSLIMSIVVKERTKEIGVRKALGATPWSIVSLILQESIFTTLIAGLIGLLIGVGILQVLAEFIEHEFFKSPRVNVRAIVTAIGLIVFFGGIAGLIPAIRAVMIKPVEALRDE
ncbi:MAG: putative ABC transport system permease protein [Flavobacteriales bacterium]|jgi:putative ABC transport system permease protein